MKIHRSAEEALAVLNSHAKVFIQGAAATPLRLVEALVENYGHLRDVEIFHLHTVGDAKYTDPVFSDSFRTSAFFIGPNLRPKFQPGRVDYLPCTLSEIPQYFWSQIIKLNFALVHVSPPDRHGYCSLGTSVDAAKAAVETADIVIAQINAKMPRVHGDGFIHVDQIDHAIEINEPLPEEPVHVPSETESRIGLLASSLIENGSTLHVGIGAIPNSVLQSLRSHRHLGVHSEMWSDGVLDLIKRGVIDNSKKKTHRWRTVAGFITGSREVYEYADDNPSVLCLDISRVNDPTYVALNPKVAAINSAVQVDLTGQVCADSIGHRVISGAGGQMDFMRGASLSSGGKSIIAITSRAKSEKSRIVSALNVGAGVVTPRAFVHHIVTEYGVTDLFGKTLDQRAKALIAIAHPDDRETLDRQWYEIWKDH
jgi:acyl-CoA hydrolase